MRLYCASTCPGVEVWAYGSRVNGESHDGSDLDLALRGPALEPLDGGFYDLLEAIEKSNIPILVQAHDWAMLPESFRREIERGYVVLQEGAKQTAANSWHEVRLGDVMSFANGRSSPERSGDSLYSVYGSNGIIGKSNEMNADANTIVIGRVGSYCGSLHFSNENCWITDNAIQAKAVGENDSKFFFFLLQSLGLNEWRSGSGQPLLNQTILSSIPTVIPSLPTQRAIAHVLGTLDDKIELNRKMNETLEAMAGALFKSWFVDFEPVRAKMDGRWRHGESLPGLPSDLYDLFPGSLVESELGEIPKGWEVRQFSDIVTQLRDNENPAVSPDTEFSHFSIPAYDEGQTPKLELGANIKSTKSRVRQDTVLLSKLNPEIKRVWLVDVAPDERAICSTEFLVLKARPPFQSCYVYCLALSSFFRQQIESIVTGTSKSHQRAPANAILSLEATVPSAQVIEAFQRSASGLLQRSMTLLREARGLAAQRDGLLPGLVSGEVGPLVAGVANAE